MKSIILAAGYATRLYPLTENFPKPLLSVEKSTILDRLLSDIDDIEDVSEHIIISNHKFIKHFEEWKAKSDYEKTITILDDGSTENENRLGAVKDLLFAIKTFDIDDDILVLAGDNVLDFSLADFVRYQKETKSSVIMRHYESELKKLQKTGVVIIDKNDKVLEMQEKPEKPASNWAVPPFYIYKKEDIPALKELVESGACATDAPGDFIASFCKKGTVYAWQMSGNRYDIGDMASYRAVQKLFQS